MTSHIWNIKLTTTPHTDFKRLANGVRKFNTAKACYVDLWHSPQKLPKHTWQLYIKHHRCKMPHFLMWKNSTGSGHDTYHSFFLKTRFLSLDTNTSYLISQQMSLLHVSDPRRLTPQWRVCVWTDPQPGYTVMSYSLAPSWDALSGVNPLYSAWVYMKAVNELFA